MDGLGGFRDDLWMILEGSEATYGAFVVKFVARCAVFVGNLWFWDGRLGAFAASWTTAS